MSTKAAKQQILDAIVKELKLGKPRAKIMAKIVAKWQMSSRTFDRFLKKASEDHSKQQGAIKEKLVRVEEEAAIEARKLEIMTVNERKVVLSQIASGELILSKWYIGAGYQIKKNIVPNYSERISAIAEMNKMEGDYAPVKAPVGKDGEPAITSKQVIIVNGKEIEF
jgi:hypothetical protein